MRSIFSFMQGNVLVLTASQVIRRFFESMTVPFFPLYILALGGSGVEIGLVYALGFLGGLILLPVGGYVADHRGRVKLVAIVTYALAFTQVFYIIAQDWITLAIGRFVHALFLFHMPAVNALMADSLPPRKRGIGFATTGAIPASVALFSPLVGGFVISYIFGGGDQGLAAAMRVFYVGYLLAGLLVATIRLKFLKETLQKSDSSIPLHNIPLLLKTSYQHLFESFKWMSRTLWSFAIVAILIITFTSLAAPFWPVYAKEVIGLTPYEWGLLAFLVGAIRIIILVPLGHLVDRYGTRRTILLSILLAPIPIILFPFCSNFLEVFSALIILSIAADILRPASSAFIANSVPRERRGRLISILGQGLFIGWAGGVFASGFLLYMSRTVGSFIGGYIYVVNPQYPWFILTISFIFCFVLGFRFIHETERKEV